MLVYTAYQRLLVELDRVRVHRPALLHLHGSDYPSHDAQEAAIAGYLRWHSRRCHPKRRFVANFKIRRPE